MGESRYEQIRLGKNIRANLLELKQEIREEAKNAAWLTKQEEIIQCVPTSEMAYASNSRNQDTVSIENCHPDETGKFNDSTYNSLVHLTAYLCDKFDLDPENGGVIRHYDVTGKDCPRYFVQNPDAWQQFLADVADYMREYGAL